MFRIDKIFENYQTELIKAEGEIKDSEVKDWAESLHSIMNGSPKQIILDFCDATFVSSKAVEILIHQMAQSVGFRVPQLYGNYDRAPFDPVQSPVMIWVLEKPDAQCLRVRATSKQKLWTRMARMKRILTDFYFFRWVFLSVGDKKEFGILF